MNLNDDQIKDDIEKLLNSQEDLEENMTKRQWQILEAAMKIFSEKGFQGSRTSEIAKEAEVAEGTIFRYYKTKKDLLIGLLIPLITKFFKPLAIKSAEAIIENKKNKPIDELMEDLLLDRLNLIHSNFPLIKTIFMEAAYQPELLKTIQKNLGPIVIPFINNFMEQNIENENFRDKDPILITRTMMSLLLGYIVLSNVFPDYFSSENDAEEIKQMVDIFLHGVAK